MTKVSLCRSHFFVCPYKTARGLAVPDKEQRKRSEAMTSVSFFLSRPQASFPAARQLSSSVYLHPRELKPLPRASTRTLLFRPFCLYCNPLYLSTNLYKYVSLLSRPDGRDSGFFILLNLFCLKYSKFTSVQPDNYLVLFLVPGTKGKISWDLCLYMSSRAIKAFLSRSFRSVHPDCTARVPSCSRL